MRPPKIYRGSRRRVKRVRVRDHWSPEMWFIVIWLVFLLIVGLVTPLACAAVISVMLIAGLLAHRRNGFFVFRDGYEYVLVLSAVCLALAMLGPGRASLDNAAGIAVTGWAGTTNPIGSFRLSMARS